jgi:hypothetical protein
MLHPLNFFFIVILILCSRSWILELCHISVGSVNLRAESFDYSERLYSSQYVTSLNYLYLLVRIHADQIFPHLKFLRSFLYPLYAHINVIYLKSSNGNMALEIYRRVDGASRSDHIHWFAMLPDVQGIEQFKRNEKCWKLYLKTGNKMAKRVTDTGRSILHSVSLNQV